MTSQEPKDTPTTGATGEKTPRASKRSSRVTEARAAAQRVKLDTQAEMREQGAAEAKEAAALKKARRKKEQKQGQLQATRRANTTIWHAVDDYLLDHEGGNHSPKTLQWHRTSLGLLQHFLQEEREITLVGEVDAPDISAWFAHLRKTPGSYGQLADRAAARNRAILWLLYDTGIRLSELCGLRTGDFDRKHGVLTVKGKGSKERRVALGQNCLRNLLIEDMEHAAVCDQLAGELASHDFCGLSYLLRVWAPRL